MLISSCDSEVRLESFPNSTDTHSHRQSDFLQSNPRGLVHHYLEGKLRLEANLRARNVIADFETRDLALTFDNISTDEIAVFDSHINGRTDSQVSAGDNGTNEVQFPVTINSCPIVENDQSFPKIKFLPIKSTGRTRITLYALHDGRYVARKIFHATHRIFKIVGVVGYNELPLVCIGGRVASEFQNGGIVDARIESAPELVQHLSEFEGKWENPVRFDGLDKEFPCPVIVHLWPRSISLICVKGVPETYEGLAVNFRPRNALPTRIEW